MDRRRRGQFALFDLVVLGGIVATIAMLVPSALLSRREEVRRDQCQDNLRRIGRALEQHHQAQGQYPPAAIQPDSGVVWVLKNEQEQMVVTHANWAILLLPYIGEEQLAASFRRQRPISDPTNAKVRTAELPWMKCAADPYHRPDNPYRCILNSGQEIVYARGNYAINAGTNSMTPEPGDINRPVMDGASSLSEGTRQIWWGNGVAGINKSFSKKDMINGLSTMVAVDEVRTGLVPPDSRGSWALGQIGCSITFGHGVYGDATGPNSGRRDSDRTIGAVELINLLGRPRVKHENMSVPRYAAGARQATARSKHPSGVNVLMLDGSSHFVSDCVDLNVWHAIHSRKTTEKIPIGSLVMPADEEARNMSFYQNDVGYLEELVATCTTRPTQGQSPQFFTNSIGMKFVKIPAGDFVMGLPDVGMQVGYRGATPAHVVRITKPFCLGTYAVTQQEYRQVMKKNPSWQITIIDDGKEQLRDKNTDWYPVEQVSWYDAAEFCRRLSELPAERQLARRYRLPTEAEWEYACRAGSTAQGNARLAHSIGPVYQDEPNAFGVCGMYCSVWEWCADGFSRYYYARSPENDPQGASSTYLRVARGSEWLFTKDATCQVFNPWGFPPSSRNRFVGFRVVCENGPK